MRRIVFLALLLGTAGFAQPPDTLWTRYFDLDGDAGTLVTRAAETPDGGYVFPVSVFTNDRQYCRVTKTDEEGNLIWSTPLRGECDAFFYDISIAPNGTIAAFGTQSACNGDSLTRMYVAVLGSNGDSLRSYFVGDGAEHISGFTGTTCSDGGYIIGGLGGNEDFRHRGHVIKLDSNGVIEWSNEYGRRGYTPIYAIRQTRDGGFIVGGHGQLEGIAENQLWVLKLDEHGGIEWERLFGDVAMNNETYAVIQLADGGYLLGGSSYTDWNAGCFDFTIIRLDSAGEEAWTRTFTWGGFPNMCDWENVRSLHELPNGDILMVGSSEEFTEGVSGTVLARFDADGELLWRDIYMPGSSNWGGMVTSTGHVVVTGWVPYQGRLRTMLMKTDTVYTTIEGASDLLPLPSAFHVSSYPNPFNATLTITFDLPNAGNVTSTLYNSLGQKLDVLTDRVYTAGTHKFEFDGTLHSSGSYFIRIEAANNVKVIRSILLK